VRPASLGVLNRVKSPGWRISLACPAPKVTSMNGVTVHAQCTLEDACAADAVIVGSGIRTRDIANDPELMGQLLRDAHVSLALQNIVPYLP
jgi:transcriptional regulator GlxA family with amidase domain